MRGLNEANVKFSEWQNVVKNWVKRVFMDVVTILLVLVLVLLLHLTKQRHKITTKSLQNHTCYHTQHKLSGGGYPAAEEGAGPGARGGTEDDDQGLALSDDFFIKSGRRLSSVPTSNLYKQQLLHSQFHFTRIPRPSKFSTHKQIQFQANNSSSQVCTSIYLSIYLQPLLLLLLLLLYVVLLLYMSSCSCCCCSCKKLNFRVWILCVRALLICLHGCTLSQSSVFHKKL